MAGVLQQALPDLLQWMAEHGSSVTLDWGEDNGLWECSFISGGERFTMFAQTPYDAAFWANRRAMEAAGLIETADILEGVER